MTDQNIPAVTDNDRRVAHEWAASIGPDMNRWTDRERAAARVILDAVPEPPLPTLADMTVEERRECQWMQADTEAWGRVVITDPCANGAQAGLFNRRGNAIYAGRRTVTPRPDLPRMEWPGEQKPSLTLPEGWRLADHQERGRVIVTKPTPDRYGYVYYAFPTDALSAGCGWHYCDPAVLTFLDTDQ